LHFLDTSSFRKQDVPRLQVGDILPDKQPDSVIHAPYNIIFLSRI
jgi:hypothetical protein